MNDVRIFLRCVDCPAGEPMSFFENPWQLVDHYRDAHMKRLPGWPLPDRTLSGRVVITIVGQITPSET